MGDPVIQRIILRKENADALSLSETVKRLCKTGVIIVDENTTSLLIEGDEATIRTATQAAAGWIAVPVRRYSVPDTRMRVGR